jgi:hypothetical protein
MKMRLKAIGSGRTLLLLGVTVLLGLLAGCGSSGIPTVPVKGQVTFGGGDWPKPATLDFTATEPAAGMPNTPASAVVQGDGKFEVKLVPGEYVVNITCWEVEMQPDNPSTGKSYVPDRYGTGADRQKISVPLNSKPIEVKWDIPKK